MLQFCPYRKRNNDDLVSVGATDRRPIKQLNVILKIYIETEYRKLGQVSSRLEKQPLNCNLYSGGVSRRYRCQHCLLTHFLRKLVFDMLLFVALKPKTFPCNKY